MIYNKEDAIKELNEVLVGLLNVKIFDSESLLVEDVNIRSAALFHYLKRLDFETTGGQDIKEFYVLIDNNSYTIQVTELETVEGLSF